MPSLKLVLISTSVLSAAIVVKLSSPFIAECLPSIYNGVVLWLRPPYLYLVVNFIIFIIAASSKLQSKNDEGAPPDAASTVVVPTQMEVGKSTTVGYPVDSSDYEVEQEKGMVLESFQYADEKGGAPPLVIDGEDGDVFVADATSNKENEFAISKSTWPVPENTRSVENSPSSKKPLVSTRFARRKNVKNSPEGMKTALGVSRPKTHDTLESTWRAITEGRPIPLTRQLKKSDTWDHCNHHPQGETPPPVKKAETFNDRTNIHTPSPGDTGRSSGKLRKDASPSQDELNRRVEAFIKKFNEEMRLQRQESLKQYMEMVGHSARVS